MRRISKVGDLPPPRNDAGRDVWWCCLRPNCVAFFVNPGQRDKHMETCSGCEEIPF